jgi:DNA polymerase-3 subunit beta
MEFTARRGDLVKELQLVQGIVERKSSIPILSNVLLEAEGGAVSVSATDLDVSLRGGLPSAVRQAGAVTLQARKLYEVMRSLPEAEVVVRLLPDSWVTIECGQSHFKMAGLPREDFPTLPEGPPGGGVELPGPALRDLIARTSFAITAEDARYYLGGALLLLEDQRVVMVATDGHRLSYAERKGEVKVKEAQRILIPKKAIQELGRLLEESDTARFHRTENHLVFSLGHRLLASKTIEGQFPAFEKVVGGGGGRLVELDREALAAALRRVSLLSSERSRAVRISLSTGQLELSASSPDLGEAREAVSTAYRGEAIEVGFNAQYLLDFLAVAGTEGITIELKDGDSQGLLRPQGLADTDHRYVVMPMRL